MRTFKRPIIRWGATIVVLMMTVPAMAETGLTPESEDLPVLLLMVGLYLCVYALVIGSITGLVYLLFKWAGWICNLLANVVPVTPGRGITKQSS